MKYTIEELKKLYTSSHNHTVWSFLDGYNPIKKFVARAKELGMKHLAITDHNSLAGVIDFQKECKEAGIIPILGVEGYFTWDTNMASLPVEERTAMAIEKAREAGVLDQDVPDEISPRTGKPIKKKAIKKSDVKDIIKPYEYDMRQYHIILIAINQVGWGNLVKLQSEAADKCTYNGRFLCDDAMLEKYSEGLVMTTACVGNAAARLLANGDYDKAIIQLSNWHRIFGDRFFLEIQPLDIKKQWQTNLGYMTWAKESGVKIIASNDVHWTTRADYDDHDTLLCIGMGKIKDDPARMRYSDDFWLKDAEEMVDSFESQAETIAVQYGWSEYQTNEYFETCIEAIANTSLIANLVEDNIKLGSDKPLFPIMKIPNGLSAEVYLTHKCYDMLYKYYKKHPEISLKVYEARLREELDIINPKGFASYMLINEEMITWSNNNGIPTGPGRGSAAGSLVLFLLGVTKEIDPIKNELLFSRFLTADRTAPPDIDSDYEYFGRHRVVSHLEDIYNKENVTHIGTYTLCGVKSGLKDVGRVLNIDFTIMNSISKKIDEVLDKPQPKFKDFDALRNGDGNEKKKWSEFNALEQDNKELFRLARAFEGIARGPGIHASGILVTPMPVSDLFPTRKAKDGSTVTLYTGTQLEDLGAIKFDVLGLKTLSVIKDTLYHIDPNLSFQDLYDIIDVDDPEIFKMICEKKTDGLFQIESNMFKGMIDDIKPNSMNDIIAITSLGRPGPLSAGMPKDYANRKNGLEEAVEPIRNTGDILKDTHMCICYQEQIMKISVRIAGFNLNQSDSIVRKIFGKKKKDQMEMLRRMFHYGKVNTDGPSGWLDDSRAPWYDPSGKKYGSPILGACNNGYSEDEVMRFWTNIEGFADYLFNKSHAACYSYSTMLTGYLKKYYPTQFMAALLSAEDKDEDKERYIFVAEEMGIKITVPDINKSGLSFTPDKNTILYGLGSIKGVGDASIPAILENRPYSSIEDAFNKIGKKAFNKTVGMSLIKAGAFNFLDDNRHSLMNQLMDVRKDKDDRYNEATYNDYDCMAMEQSTLGASITFKPYWKTIEVNQKIKDVPATILSLEERVDKKGNMMGFVQLEINKSKVKGLIFASKYCKMVAAFDMERGVNILVSGKKDDRGGLLIDMASKNTSVLDNVLEFVKPISKTNILTYQDDECDNVVDISTSLIA